jgi:hypothetical protein
MEPKGAVQGAFMGHLSWFFSMARISCPERKQAMMKRLICAALALSLVGATAASARPFHGGGFGHRHSGWHGRGDGGALLGLGLGLFALGAIAASQQDRYYDRYDYGPPPPPPPPPAYGYGY